MHVVLPSSYAPSRHVVLRSSNAVAQSNLEQPQRTPNTSAFPTHLMEEDEVGTTSTCLPTSFLCGLVGTWPTNRIVHIVP